VSSRNRLIPFPIFHFALCASVVAISTDLAFADTFQLRSGGQVSGREVARLETGGYVIHTAQGARITLTKSQIQKIVRKDDRLQEYSDRSRAILDTAPAHRQLAQWCKQEGLKQQATHHLKRLLELDPQDEAARLSLGYQRVGTQWLTRKELMAARGMRFYDGSYRTAQDIALRERASQQDARMLEWQKNIKRWLGWLSHRRGSRATEAKEQLSQIRDPLATPIIIKFLTHQDDPQIRNLLITILAQIDAPLAIGKLVRLSLVDSDPEVRLQCLEYLMRSKRPLSISPYIKALHHNDNVIVNRAGLALQEIGNPEAISPLVDALVTTHVFKVGEGSPGQMNASMSTAPGGGGAGGFSFGGGGLKTEKRALKNFVVHQALVHLSSDQNFGFDQTAWRHWLINQRMHAQHGARRDE
jgi:hypothetical protein